MKARLLLFDIDGTLLLSGGAGGRAMHSAGQELFGKAFIFEVNTAGKLDTEIYAELATLNATFDLHSAHDAYRDTYLRHLEAELERVAGQVSALPGIHELLEHLGKEDYTLGLLTGNYGPAAALKLRAAGLEPDLFKITAFGDEAKTRPDLPPLAIEKYGVLTGETLLPEEVVVIGDTPRDIHCARVNGCVAVGVATGQFAAADLQDADLVLESFAGPGAFLELLSLTG